MKLILAKIHRKQKERFFLYNYTVLCATVNNKKEIINNYLNKFEFLNNLQINREINEII